MLAITALYAGFIALLFLILTFRVILYRRDQGISLGDKGDKEMFKRIRVQANCAEYAPIGLILLALVEAQGAPALAVHALGLMLLIGRVMHGYGLSASPVVIWMRIGGMLLTTLMIGFAALGLIAHAVL